MTAVRIADASLCAGCERRLPSSHISTVEHCCLACLDAVRAQVEESRRGLLLRVLAADLRCIPSLTEADVATITAIVRRAWS